MAKKKNYRLLLSARIAATGMVDAKKLGLANAGCHIPVQTALVESVQMVPHGLIFQLQTTLPTKLLSARTRDTVIRPTGYVFAEKVSQEMLASGSNAPWTLTLASSVLEMGIA